MRARAWTAAQALRDFLRGFLGLPGTPGASATPPADPAAARRALEERAAQRRSCC